MLIPKQYLLAFRKFFCKHDEVFSFRKYNDYDFHEYCKCSKCEKTLKWVKGFDEDIRG